MRRFEWQAANIDDLANAHGHLPTYLNKHRGDVPVDIANRYYVLPTEMQPVPEPVVEDKKPAKENPECQRKCKELEALLEAETSRVSCAERDAERLKALLDEEINRAMRAERDVDRLKAELMEVVHKYESSGQQQQLDLEEAVRKAIAETEARMLAERKKLLESQRLLASKSAEQSVEALLAEIEQLKEENDWEKQDKKNQIEQLEAQHERDARHALLEAVAEKEKALIAKYEDMMKATVDDMEAQHKWALEAAIAAAESALMADYRERLSKKKSKLQDARARHKADETEIENDERQLKKQDEEIDRLQSLLEAKDSDHSGAYADLVSKLKKKKAKLEATRSKYHNDIKALKNDHAEQVSDHIAALSAAETELQKGEDFNTKLRKYNEDLCKHIVELEEKLGTGKGTLGKDAWKHAAGRATGNDDYHFGDFTRALISPVKNKHKGILERTDSIPDSFRESIAMSEDRGLRETALSGRMSGQLHKPRY